MGRGAKHLQMIFSFVKIKPRLVEVAISYALKTIITKSSLKCHLHTSDFTDIE